MVAALCGLGCTDRQSAGADQITDGGRDAGSAVDAGDTDSGACITLFGAPSENSGLTSTQCSPACACQDLVFQPPVYSPSTLAQLAAQELANPPPLLSADPYDTPDLFPDQADKFCAVTSEPESPLQYRLTTYNSLQAVESAGATLTHFGGCGLCSSLQDLVVYLTRTDLAGPVRECAMLGIDGTEAEVITCLQAIGFSPSCAQIWHFNTRYTRQHCLEPCLAAIDAPYHRPDGELNPCIQCDEEKSGPVFKAVAGRTRRNSGVPSALCRPCATIAPVRHDYP